MLSTKNVLVAYKTKPVRRQPVNEYPRVLYIQRLNAIKIRPVSPQNTKSSHFQSNCIQKFTKTSKAEYDVYVTKFESLANKELYFDNMRAHSTTCLVVSSAQVGVYSLVEDVVIKLQWLCAW